MSSCCPHHAPKPQASFAGALGGSRTIKNISADVGVCALFAIGSYLTADDGPMKDASPGTKRLLNLVFAAPMAVGIPGVKKGILSENLKEGVHGLTARDLEGKWKAEGVPDFLMHGLTTAIGALGVATNDRELMTSAAMLAALFAIAGHLEDGIMAVGQDGIAKLKQTVPETVTRVNYGKDGRAVYEKGVKLTDVAIGEHVVVPQGETVPVDGHIVSGKGHYQPSELLRGETLRKSVVIGEDIAQGAIAHEGEMVVKAAQTAEQSSIFRNINYLMDTEGKALSKAEHSVGRIVNKFYIPAMMAAVAGQFVYSYWTGHKEKKETAKTSGVPAQEEREHHLPGHPNAAKKDTGHVTHTLKESAKDAASLAIKMAPCAVYAAMLVMPFFKNRLAGAGVFVRENAALEKAAKITHVLTDIRGTLTRNVSEFQGLQMWDKAKGVLAKAEAGLSHDLLGMLGRAEGKATHGIAEGLCNAAKAHGHTLETLATDQINTARHGVFAKLHDGEVLVGNAKHFADHQVVIPKGLRDAMQALPPGDAAIMRINRGGAEHWGVAQFHDPLREGVVDAVRNLRKAGKEVVLVTGMEKRTAEHYAKMIDPHHPPKVYADQLEIKAIAENGAHQYTPAKVQVLEQYAKPGNVIAAVGDGLNDAAFMSAVKDKGGLSFAIASTGAGSTKNVASMVIQGIHQVEDIIDASKRLNQFLWANVTAAGAWISFLIGSHVLGLDMKVQTASILHEAPTVALALGSFAESKALGKYVRSHLPHAAHAAGH